MLSRLGEGTKASIGARVDAAISREYVGPEISSRSWWASTLRPSFYVTVEWASSVRSRIKRHTVSALPGGGSIRRRPKQSRSEAYARWRPPSAWAGVPALSRSL